MRVKTKYYTHPREEVLSRCAAFRQRLVGIATGATKKKALDTLEANLDSTQRRLVEEITSQDLAKRYSLSNVRNRRYCCSKISG